MKKINLVTTFAQLKAAGACDSGYKKLVVSLGGVRKYGKDTPISLIQILESNGVEDCLWALCAVTHPERDKIARFIACDCAEAVLWIYERFDSEDKRLHEAIRVARLFAIGHATIKELDAARAACDDAAWDAADAACDDAADAARAAWAAMDAIDARAAWDAWDAARDAAMAAWAAMEAAVWDACDDAGDAWDAWDASGAAAMAACDVRDARDDARVARSLIVREYIV